jgi:REP element-mobilizing transposase RayT
MIRGIERQRIFRDDRDRAEFLRRLDKLVPELGFVCFAWALMTNHVHLALRTASVPLQRLMSRLGTGYARYFNERHDRVGHLLQNRYRSRLVTDDEDLVGLVLYIHRNPIEAGLVAAPESLGRYPWCGHGALTGERPRHAFECPEEALELFDRNPGGARRRLRRWIEAPPGPEPELPREAPRDRRRPKPGRASHPGALADLILRICRLHGVTVEELGPRSRRGDVLRARADLAWLAVKELGFSSRTVATALGVSDSTISRALARRGRTGTP